jgi:hypothetical protein
MQTTYDIRNYEVKARRSQKQRNLDDWTRGRREPAKNAVAVAAHAWRVTQKPVHVQQKPVKYTPFCPLGGYQNIDVREHT